MKCEFCNFAKLQPKNSIIQHESKSQFIIIIITEMLRVQLTDKLTSELYFVYFFFTRASSFFFPSIILSNFSFWILYSSCARSMCICIGSTFIRVSLFAIQYTDNIIQQKVIFLSFGLSCSLFTVGGILHKFGMLFVYCKHSSI